MKFAWIEDTIQVEIFDDEGQAFVPPQFKEVGTGNGVIAPGGLNRPAGAGEREGIISPSERTKGMDGELYKVVNYKAVPKSDMEILSLQFLQLKKKTQRENQQYCQNLIYSKFPQGIQSSMALGIYPSAEVTRMTDFIAASIEEENRLHDAVEVAINLLELEAITPNWPELV